jgi:hypothetical protein
LLFGPVWIGFSVSRGASGAGPIRQGQALAGCQIVEQVSDPRLLNKFTKQVFEWLFGPVWLAVQPNPDRILTESRTESQPNLDRISESLSLFNRIRTEFQSQIKILFF